MKSFSSHHILLDLTNILEEPPFCKTQENQQESRGTFQKQARGLGNSSPGSQGFIRNSIAQMVCIIRIWQSTNAMLRGLSIDSSTSIDVFEREGDTSPGLYKALQVCNSFSPLQRNGIETSYFSQSTVCYWRRRLPFALTPNLDQQRLSEEGCCVSYSPLAAEETLRLCYLAFSRVACCISAWWPAKWTSKFTKDRSWLSNYCNGLLRICHFSATAWRDS